MVMDRERIVFYEGRANTTNEFLFSNLHLGIFENEVSENLQALCIKPIKFNRLDMILALNNKLIAN